MEQKQMSKMATINKKRNINHANFKPYKQIF